MYTIAFLIDFVNAVGDPWLREVLDDFLYFDLPESPVLEQISRLFFTASDIDPEPSVFID